MGHECLILLKIFTLLYLSKEVRKHKDTNDFRDAYCGERVQSSKLIARFTAHIDFTICVVSAITLVITVIFSIRVCPMLCSLVSTRCGVLVVSAPLKHSNTLCLRPSSIAMLAQCPVVTQAQNSRYVQHPPAVPLRRC